MNKALLVCVVLLTICDTKLRASPKAEQLAHDIHIDRATFAAASVQVAVNYLEQKAQEQLQPGQKLHLYSYPGDDTPITYSFVGKTLYDSLLEISRQTGLPLKATEDALYLGEPIKEVPIPRGNRLGEEDNIKEAVFRYLFGDNASGQQNTVAAYFISVNGDKDPDDAFLARFAKHIPPVKKESASSRGEGSVVLDKATGQHGLSFYLGGIRWVSDSKVEVDGGYYEANLSASGNVYEVVHTAKRWVVTKNTMTWISSTQRAGSKALAFQAKP
ncbi:MAG: hypothetical protein QM796_21060 [Chthoniobacteraceae bacterium]